ncbi:MAG: YicC/YloC family endoribonuclease [Pseudomonadota bacterium]
MNKLNSMTGYATGQGAIDGFSWDWELRCVNGKGLDLRFRSPELLTGLDADLRTKVTASMSRGNLSVSLKVQSSGAEGGVELDADRLETVLIAMAEVEARAMERGLSLAPANAADVLALRGVFDVSKEQQDTTTLRKEVLSGFDSVLKELRDMQGREGAVLAKILGQQIDALAALIDDAAAAAEARKPEAKAQLEAAMARVLENSDQIDEARVTQELAIIAMKSDVTEELDRLRAHVVAARDLIKGGSPAGRKLDFLAQEFNREANTICSKSQNAELTSVGLELKSLIEQMREQVQNVE